jgi:hypothetical protein
LEHSWNVSELQGMSSYVKDEKDHGWIILEFRNRR